MSICSGEKAKKVYIDTEDVLNIWSTERVLLLICWHNTPIACPYLQLFTKAEVISWGEIVFSDISM